MATFKEQAQCGNLSALVNQLVHELDKHQQLQDTDPAGQLSEWETALGIEIPQQGIGVDALVREIKKFIVPNGSPVLKPGCTSFITTGATSIGILMTLVGAAVAPQRMGLTAFNFLEHHSLDWLKNLFGLNAGMHGIYSSGGSVANLLGLAAARQRAYEKIGLDVSEHGMNRSARVYASQACHRSIHRACAVLGLGRQAVQSIPVDLQGCISVAKLKDMIETDKNSGHLLLAIIANAGTTDAGAIDPIAELAEIASQYAIWLHVDGAYGLPGILDPKKTSFYNGIECADSVVVDPHKWLGAPVGIGTTFFKDHELQTRTFSQGAAAYYEGTFSFENENFNHSLINPGFHYSDLGIELSAPSRGAVVWALIREIGVEGIRSRICRHNEMAAYLAQRIQDHPAMELCIEPMLSIVCFRYKPPLARLNNEDMNAMNRIIHHRLLENGSNMPSTTMIGDKLVIRPCFIGARTEWHHADDLFEEVLAIGQELSSH